MIRVLNPRNRQEIENIFSRLAVDEVGTKIMAHKAHHHLLLIESLNVPAANILKQEMLSLGGDAALHRGACDFSVEETPCLLMGTYQTYQRLMKKLALQPFGLKKLGRELRSALEKFFSVPPPIQAGPYRFDFSRGPYLMGILNVTPDSFSGDGLFERPDDLLRQAERFVSEGAHLLDLGGESTRPAHAPVPLEEERRRVIPAVKALAARFQIPISVDTSKAEIAEEALEAGAHLINDVTGLLGDSRMAEVARKSGAPAVVMHHAHGEGRRDLLGEICAFFEERLLTLENQGIPRERVILDPGIGFGKNPAENLLILKHLGELRIFGRPLLLGTSRKSFIGHVLNVGVHDRLLGTAASLVFGISGGFHFFRVHDVLPARHVLALSKAVLEARGPA